jgi:hypothetical protein
MQRGGIQTVENVVFFYCAYFPTQSLFIIIHPFSFVLKKMFDILVLTRIGSAPPHLADWPIYSVQMCVSWSFLS